MTRFATAVIADRDPDRARFKGTFRSTLLKPATSIPQSDPIAKGKRAMQRLKRGVGLFVFLGLVCAQAAAQDIPEQARKEICA